METTTPMINTQRLKPFCQRTSRTVMSILENGDVSMEILAKPQSGVPEGTQMVQEMVYISGDGTKVQVYQNNQVAPNDDGSGNTLTWTCQEFAFPELPQKLWKKYMHVYRFIELVKSRTPKIVLITVRAKCKLMENSPAPDFQLDFHDDMSILVSKRKVHITDSDGNSISSEVDNLSQSIPENILERFFYLKQCESECLRLEDSFNNLRANEGAPELFPITIGTITSPVFIPLPQPTTPASFSSSPTLAEGQQCYHNKETSVFSERARALSDSSFSSYSSQTASSLSAQSIDPSANTKAFETPVKYECEQQHFCTSSYLPVNEKLHFSPQVMNNPLNYQVPVFTNNTQSSISNFEDGATISNMSIPQTRHGFLEKENDKEKHTPSLPCSFDNFPHLCHPEFTTLQNNENCAQVFQGHVMSEGYNKLKYCSRTSQVEDVVNSENLQLQQELINRKMFEEQLEIPGHSTSVNERVPYQHDFTHPEPLSTNHAMLQQNVHPNFNCPSLSMQSVHASSNNSVHSQTGMASPSSSLLSGAEMSSNHITKEILDASAVFCFSPSQSSSIVNTTSNSNYDLPTSPTSNYDLPTSPKKLQRKVSSPAVSSLEKQIESLDLNTAQRDGRLKNETLQSSGNENCDTVGCLPDIQRTSMKNTRSLSLNSSYVSSCKSNSGLRSRPDLFNTSLPLSFDSRQFGNSNIPMSPQKQFLQSSDNGSDRGSIDFVLPPQVRNSLDLSTSSNYSDSPSSSQSSSCEPLYQMFIPYTGWASYYASGAVWVLYNDGTQLGVKASEKTMTFIDQDGTHQKYNNKDIVPEIVKMKLEKFPSILNTVLNCKR